MSASALRIDVTRAMGFVRSAVVKTLLANRAPLPFSAVRNLRTLIADNLVSLLIRCAEHPQAGGEPFLVSDAPGLETLPVDSGKTLELLQRTPALEIFEALRRTVTAA